MSGSSHQRRQLRRNGPRCPTCRYALMGDRWCSFCRRVHYFHEHVQRPAAEAALRWAQQILGQQP